MTSQITSPEISVALIRGAWHPPHGSWDTFKMLLQLQSWDGGRPINPTIIDLMPQGSFRAYLDEIKRVWGKRRGIAACHSMGGMLGYELRKQGVFDGVVWMSPNPLPKWDAISWMIRHDWQMLSVVMTIQSPRELADRLTQDDDAREYLRNNLFKERLRTLLTAWFHPIAADDRVRVIAALDDSIVRPEWTKDHYGPLFGTPTFLPNVDHNMMLGPGAYRTAAVVIEKVRDLAEQVGC